MRVLIAEDDSVSRRLLEALLAKWGYDVVVAKDGLEAWEILQQEDSPRLAILDWMMPGIDGIQICRQVRKSRREAYIYILLLTAKTQRQDLLEGLEAGADDYVTKPFDANELKARLRAGRRVLDLQAELLSMREALREQATHDPLTGLPNRLLFSDRLTQRLAHARRQGELLAVMFLDLDKFKQINDTLGHNVGDLLLKEVARRLLATLREVDTISRMGGDEFVVIASDIRSADDAVAVAEKVIQALSEPYHLDGHEVQVSASIGISIYPADGSDVETLVKNADTAMYRAKEQGRNNYQLHTETLTAIALERAALETNLRLALERHEFLVHYQPRVDIMSRKILGLEALIRWRSPDVGLVQPAQFIPVAEETGLIAPMTDFVLRTACRQNRAWLDSGLPEIDVTVNISREVFLRGNLKNTLVRLIKESGLDPQFLGLDITEHTLMQNPESSVSILHELRDLGVRVSIDDFGTGHSSLSYLRRFPVDAVKIDRSFIKELTMSPGAAATVGAIVAMAHSLRLKVIAEGVETTEQLNFLRSLDCDEMQGYFITPPVPPEDVPRLFEAADAGSEGVLPAA
jgi:diguanylate cyclase (GGDEF)-like protein